MNTVQSVVEEKIKTSRMAQKTWCGLSWPERVKAVRPLVSYLAEHGEEIAALISRENGKTMVDALATEVIPAALGVGYYCRLGKRFIKGQRISGGSILLANKQSRLVYQPYGVVGIISPWNYPFAIPFSEVVMALLAGNGVILKVASNTLQIGRALAAAFESLPLPPGLFQYIEVPGKEAGPAMIAGGVDKLFFTGSTAVGRELMALAAPRLLPLVLELGGADAAIVRSDADLERTAAGLVWAGLSNAGQSCGGAQRLFVHQSVYEEFLEILGRRVKALRVGSSIVGDEVQWDCDMGCMTSRQQKEEVRRQIQACLDGGARIYARSPLGEMDGEGLDFPALILTDVSRDMPIMREEIFGPVMAVVPVANDEEAITLANDSIYGLTGSVWTRDAKRGFEIARQIRAGAVMINDHLMSHGLAQTPWGGFGASGLGRTHGEAGFREMLQSQVIVQDLLPGVKKNLWWHPYSRQVFEGLLAILNTVGSRGLVKKSKALVRLAGFVFRYWDRS
jgi:succinate-semialdehyde dehydrogenase/glutarate-semialdehyde dehydrogenase